MLKKATQDNDRHLLLVDDDRLVLITMANALRQVGYHVTTTESVDEAESWLAEGHHQPHLVILDIQMPGGCGLSFAQRLRELDRIPFIILSAYSDEETVAQATQQGALGYAVKPLEPLQLVPIIKTALVQADRLQELGILRRQLQHALDSERDINVAVGITMMQRRLTRAAAFDLLRQSARTQQCKLNQLAGSIIDAAETLNL